MKLLKLFILMAPALLAQTVTQPQPAVSTTPSVLGFFGVSADPNGSVNDIQMDIGVAKLVNSSTYVGIAAHLSKGVTPGERLGTKVQLHVAQKLFPFRSATFFWTAEAGPDISSQALTQPATSTATTAATSTTQLQIGYAIGSGPLLSIPIGKGIYLAPHAEVVKGSLQDLGWRGGILFMFGDK